MLVVHFDDVPTRKVKISVPHDGFGEECDFLNLEEVQVYSACIEGDACRTGFSCEALPAGT